MNSLILFLLLLLFVFTLSNQNQNQNKREGFSQWSDKTINDFLIFQNTINPGIVFDTSLIQDQSSEEDAIELLQTGKWRWSPEVEELYMDAVSQNPYIRTNPEDATNTAKTIYNENAILQILERQTPRGQFLLHGQKIQSDPSLIKDNTFGINSGLISKTDTVIRCAVNPETNRRQLLKTKFIGNDGVFHARQYKTTFIDPDSEEDLHLSHLNLSHLRQWCL